MKKKIIHINNPVNIGKTIAHFQRKGPTSCVDVLTYLTPYANNISKSEMGDIVVRLTQHKLKNALILFVTFLKITAKYNVIHIHSPPPFNHIFKDIDIFIWILLRKKVIYHYHGSDIRGKRAGWVIRYFVKNIFVSTPDLLEWAPKQAIWIPNPFVIGVNSEDSVRSSNKKIIILHAPSNPSIKGTIFVEKAIDELISEGYDIELRLLHNVSHEVVISEIKQADIIIDQLLVGWYGMFALEAMLYKKPVCVYISESLENLLPNDVLINTTPLKIKEDLILLIKNEKLRSKVGTQGYLYLTSQHDAVNIVRWINSNIFPENCYKNTEN